MPTSASRSVLLGVCALLCACNLTVPAGVGECTTFEECTAWTPPSDGPGSTPAALASCRHTETCVALKDGDEELFATDCEQQGGELSSSGCPAVFEGPSCRDATGVLDAEPEAVVDVYWSANMCGTFVVEACESQFGGTPSTANCEQQQEEPYATGCNHGGWMCDLLIDGDPASFYEECGNAGGSPLASGCPPPTETDPRCESATNAYSPGVVVHRYWTADFCGGNPGYDITGECSALGGYASIPLCPG